MTVLVITVNQVVVREEEEVDELAVVVEQVDVVDAPAAVVVVVVRLEVVERGVKIERGSERGREIQSSRMVISLCFNDPLLPLLLPSRSRSRNNLPQLLLGL